MGSFSALLLFARDIEKVLRFAKTGLGVYELVFGHGDGEIILDYGGVQAARRDFHFGPGDRLGGKSTTDFTAAHERQQLFMPVELLVINMHAVICDEHA